MVIAEISQNFTCLAEAKELVRLAKENGADLAKAQLFDSMKLYGKKVPAELSFCDAKALFNYGASIGIEVFFSVFDIERVKWGEEIGVKRYKLACGFEDTDTLCELTKIRKPIFYSIKHLQGHRPVTRLTPETLFLFCVPKYPAPLNALKLDEIYFDEWVVGFSDHTTSLDAAKIAISRGAQIIEKHFAVDHKTGTDAEWSMTPLELRELKRFETVVKQVL